MSQRTDELAISREVKERVADRDSVDGWPCCILCGKPAPTDYPIAYSCAHYISRAQGGLGIEENILTLCWPCHQAYDGRKHKELKPILTKYLRESYSGWSEEKLTYKRS